MTTTLVYATDTARRYHATAACKALRSAQDLSDWDCWDDYCRHQHPKPHPVREMPVMDALGAGKWPCASCWPGSAAALAISSSEDDFGHVPVALDVVIHDAWTRWSACSTCKARTTPLVCVRCMEFDANRMWRIPAHPVHWPCTSALILGLVPRPA